MLPADSLDASDTTAASRASDTLARVLPAGRLRTAAIAAAPFALVAAVAAWSRLRYGAFAYHDTYGSGDAHLVLARALFVSRGEWSPPAHLGQPAAIFSDPPLIPLLFGAVARAGAPLATAPLWLSALITIVALLALFDIVRRAANTTVALAGVLLVALLPRFSFDSTEPDKVAFVLSFFIFALWFQYGAAQRPWMHLPAGLCMGLCVFAHGTGYLFLPVFVITHVALSRLEMRRLFHPLFGVALAMPLLFIGAYFWLDNAVEPGPARPAVVTTPPPAVPAPNVPPPPSAPPSFAPTLDSGGGVLPQRVDEYIDNITGIARGGFTDSAWGTYTDAIRDQIWWPVFFAAVAGCLLAAVEAVRRRRWELVPLLAWIAVVTLGFAVQAPALSHTSRYPSYVTPVFVIFAAYAVVRAAEWAARRIDAGPQARDSGTWLTAAIAAPLIVAAAASYATADNPGTRELYSPHRQLAAYLDDNGLLSDDAQLLHLAWPSITFYVLEDSPEVEPWLHNFGWGTVPPETFTRPYIQAQRIHYYAYDQTGSDYVGSADAVLARLRLGWETREVQRFCAADRLSGTCGPYVTLYELVPRVDPPP